MTTFILQGLFVVFNGIGYSLVGLLKLNLHPVLNPMEGAWELLSLIMTTRWCNDQIQLNCIILDLWEWTALPNPKLINSEWLLA